MDSMRSLNTSLPGASPSKQVSEPPEQILSAFKAAALSVTKLYQTAAADQGRARSEGYQDALDDLLSFLDKEDIGLSDGEGWRIRRWATERLDGRGDSGSQTMESEDEAAEKTDGGSSPELHRSHSATRLSSMTRASTRTVSPSRTESLAPPAINTPPASDAANTIPPQAAFTFRSTQQFPQDADMITSDLSNDPSETRREGSHTSNPPTLPRPRTNQRHASHSARQSPRTAASLGRTGQKRKFTVGDITEYFDFSGLGNGRDNFGGAGGGGGKRGRFV
ncbi:Uncharacterized protein D0Z07_7811 [Hyphodiscus hymeniophilus]|uniref:Uncharacterized protein n=1 Tax=Hyphodiscus hymeniophilus TaxID=353542 RepID=A0A9P6SLB8_9HELO|nr:Uncharacterized protein D0Z07_7811 [Hyphodiscus hymeniophilus]